MTSNTYRKQVGITKWSIGIVLVFGVLTALPALGQCEQAKLTASDAAERDRFGRAVDINGDACDYFSWRLTNASIKDYHRPDDGGMDMLYAWNEGYRGQGIKIADVENGYYRDHEDLCDILEPASQPEFVESDHGSSVLGIIAAADNRYGWTGLVPDAFAWFFSDG